MNKLSKTQWIIIAFLFILLIAIKIILIIWYEQQQPPVLKMDTTQCTVHYCVLPQGITLASQGRLTDKTPFSITLSQVPKTVKQIYISFSMKDMDMGFNRYTLQAIDDQTWQANKITLPVCVVDRVDYLMDINIDGKAYQIPFQAENKQVK